MNRLNKTFRFIGVARSRGLKGQATDAVHTPSGPLQVVRDTMRLNDSNP